MLFNSNFRLQTDGGEIQAQGCLWVPTELCGDKLLAEYNEKSTPQKYYSLFCPQYYCVPTLGVDKVLLVSVGQERSAVFLSLATVASHP